MSDTPGFWPHPQSLQARVLRRVLALLLLGAVLVAGMAWLNGRQAAWQAYDRILLGAANDIAESIRIQGGGPVVDLPVSAFELLAQAPDDRVAYAVRAADGALITGFADAATRAGMPDTDARLFFDAPMQGERARFVEVTRRFAERDFSGVIRVSVGQTLIARKAMTLRLMLDAVLPLAVAGLVLLVASYFVIRAAVRPLERIADNLLARDPYDLTPMTVVDPPREVAVMVDAMNRFMGRLDRQIGVMRNLISDTAHQLRTPVAAIRVQAEAIIEAPESPDGGQRLVRLVRRTRSLGRLLDQMLSRAMIIHRTDNVPRARLDLREVALGVVEMRDHEVLAPEAEVGLVIGDSPVWVEADEFSLSQAVGNLLSNALRHGQPPVRIGVEARGSEAWLWVLDSGAGPGEDILRGLGQRFERSKASPEDSAGLGLSIVAAVAQAFGGRVAMERTEDGFRMALVLPRVAEVGA
jgi:two-component system sensor histidine kinase TctE